ALIIQDNVLRFVKVVNGTSSILVNQSFSHTSGTFYRMRFRITGSTPTILKGRVWAEGSPEPSNWTIASSDANSPLTQGGFGICAKVPSIHPVLFDSLMAVDAS